MIYSEEELSYLEEAIKRPIGNKRKNYGVSQRLVDKAAKEGDMETLEMLLNKRASNIAKKVMKEYPEKSARWRGTEIHSRMKYTSSTLYEESIKGFGRLDGFDYKSGIIFELKPNTSWSLLKAKGQIDNYVRGVNSVIDRYKKTGEVIGKVIIYTK